MDDAAFRLCYVEGAFAWFTTAALIDQWGDDWNDAPYDCNAGRPYEWREPTAIPPYALRRIAWEADLKTPAEYAQQLNCVYSVEQINAGETPWLRSPRYVIGAPVTILAGVPLPEFIATIRAMGGQVWVPLEDRP